MSQQRKIKREYARRIEGNPPMAKYQREAKRRLEFPPILRSHPHDKLDINYVASWCAAAKVKCNDAMLKRMHGITQRDVIRYCKQLVRRGFASRVPFTHRKEA